MAEKLDLEAILDEIERDSTVNMNQLVQESARIPLLHAKWLRKLVQATREFHATQAKFDKVVRLKHDYYLGRASDEVYRKFPLHIKASKSELQMYLDADDGYVTIKAELTDATIIQNLIEQFINELNKRNFTIKNAIDYMKFQGGM